MYTITLSKKGLKKAISKNNISNLLTKLLPRNITRKFAIDLDIYGSNKKKQQNNKIKKITIISGNMMLQDELSIFILDLFLFFIIYDLNKVTQFNYTG